MGKQKHLFRIVHVDRRTLLDDNETIAHDYHYEIYYKLPWMLGGWRPWPQFDHHTFATQEKATEYIVREMTKIVKQNKEWDARDKAKKRFKKELEPVITIVGTYRFETLYNSEEGCLIKEK